MQASLKTISILICLSVSVLTTVQAGEDNDNKNVDDYCVEMAVEEEATCLFKNNIWTFDASSGTCVAKIGCYPRYAPENNVFRRPDHCLTWCIRA